MNIQQMHIELMQSLDKLNSSAFADLMPEDRDYFLNEAIVRYTKTCYTGNNPLQAGFEVIQKRTDDLKTLVVTEFPTITTVTIEENIYKADLSLLYLDENLSSLSSNKYWFFIRGRARIVKSGCTSKYINIKIYQHDDLNNTFEDPFKRPTFNEAVGYFENGNLYIATINGTSIDRVKLSFIRKPIEVKYGSVYPIPTTDVDCDLPEHTHKEIIQTAVAVALEIMESIRLQTEMALKQTIE